MGSRWVSCWRPRATPSSLLIPPHSPLPWPCSWLWRKGHPPSQAWFWNTRIRLREGLTTTLLLSRTTFKEFAEKYGRDQRFRLVQKRKDQEHFFNQFILMLKKRDKENRLRLRKMR